ncbi:MAG: hypothetical protein GY762_13860 [Proteobacteria bacterium]|nr:hypothetical protein [Pseudomonadota bacterium]
MNGNDMASKANGSLFKKMLRMLALTEERELTCEEAFELFDYYAELEQSGESMRGLMPTLMQHLRICPECAEEYQALQKMMEQQFPECETLR